MSKAVGNEPLEELNAVPLDIGFVELDDRDTSTKESSDEGSHDGRKGDDDSRSLIRQFFKLRRKPFDQHIDNNAFRRIDNHKEGGFGDQSEWEEDGVLEEKECGCDGDDDGGWDVVEDGVHPLEIQRLLWTDERMVAAAGESRQTAVWEESKRCFAYKKLICLYRVQAESD
ncbi:hypothetical protein BC829DRAFT_419711 [Chytridium lagenaria]|nr:hypothetical protein BC829DRAFT_422385 [Chytridium lagenaria]KAI8844916.1 hypothetical protein BC829DRAFT_419711 [Chytridium lagenaria]